MSKKSCADLIWLSLLVTASCGGTSGASEDHGGAAGSPSTDQGGAAGDNAGAGGDGDSDPAYGNGGLIQVDAGEPGSGDPGDDEPASCGASSFEAQQIIVEKEIEVPVEVTEEVTEQVPVEVQVEVPYEVTVTKPVTLYIMFDKSYSMTGNLGGPELWTGAVSAIKSFVNDPASAGMGVALQYFPIGGGSCSNGSGYSTPAVAAGLLPARAAALSASLDQATPNGGNTPTEGALRGATEYCKKFQADHPDEQCVAVLVTDGKPQNASGCSENSTTLANIAKAAFTSSEVVTFAVGLNGADFTLLDKIAKDGGAPDCDTASSTRYSCDVSSNPTKLSEALAKIRETVTKTETRTETRIETRTETRTVTHTVTKTEVVKQVQNTPVPCEWSIPASPSGETFDRDKVNIRLSKGDTQTTFVRVDSKDACVAGAWYYDNAEHPTRFIACEAACKDIEGAADAKIDILLGCATMVPG